MRSSNMSRLGAQVQDLVTLRHGIARQQLLAGGRYGMTRQSAIYSAQTPTKAAASLMQPDPTLMEDVVIGGIS